MLGRGSDTHGFLAACAAIGPDRVEAAGKKPDHTGFEFTLDALGHVSANAKADCGEQLLSSMATGAGAM